MDRLEFLTQREQLMENIDSIVDEFFHQHYVGDIELRDKLVTKLCDSVCDTMDPVGMA